MSGNSVAVIPDMNGSKNDPRCVPPPKVVVCDLEGDIEYLCDALQTGENTRMVTVVSPGGNIQKSAGIQVPLQQLVKTALADDDEFQELKETAKGLVKEVKTLRTDLSEANLKIKTLSTDLSEANLKIRHLEKKNETLEEKINARDKKIDTLTEEIKTLKIDLSTMTTNYLCAAFVCFWAFFLFLLQALL